MTITSFLKSKGFHSFEGHTEENSQQERDLISLTSKPKINVMEIGFNAGHSAEIFLHHNKELTLTSFDLGQHKYVRTAKEYIDITYPKRHKLIIGDSRKSIPMYIASNLQNNKYIKFDIIFIDGGHDYQIAKVDIENCRHLAHKDTIVILDDTIFTKDWEEPWTIGPTRVWSEYLQQGKVTEINRKDYSKGRGMSWGKYVL